MVALGEIEGISDKHLARLREVGIASSDALLEFGASKRGRKELAKITELGEQRVTEWVRRADLLRLPGVSNRYAELLEAADIETVRQLRRRSATRLRAQLVELNEGRRIVSRMPSETEIDAWILAAKDLPDVLKRF